MSLRTTFVLMVVFLVLGSFAIFDPLRRQEKSEEKNERESHVVWLKDRKLETISISGKFPEVRLECLKREAGCPFDGSADWIVLAPVQDNADASAVGTLASTLLNLTQNEVVDFQGGTPDPKEFGLDQPQAVVALGLKGEKEPLLLKLGKASSVSPNVYLSVSSDPHRLFLVPNYLPDMLNKDLFYWRNKRLFPSVEGTAVARIGWRQEKTGEILAIRSEKGWSLERPRKLAASKIMMEGLVSTLAYSAAKSIYSSTSGHPNAAKIIAGKPQLDVDFSDSKAKYRLRIYPNPSQSKPGSRELFARVDNQSVVYVVDAGTFDRFGKDLLDYRQRTLLDDSQVEQVDEIRFIFPRSHAETVVKRNDKEWGLISGVKPASPLSSPRINSFVDSLRDTDFKAMFPEKGKSREAEAFRTQPADLSVEVKAGGNTLLKAQFLVFDRKEVITASEGDVRVLEDPLMRAMPVRVEDLSQAISQTPMVEKLKDEKREHDGHHH